MATSEEAVLIHLDATGNDPQVYKEYDLATLEQQLIQALAENGTGELDGHESGPGETVLFLYGSSADQLYEAVEGVIRDHPLCRNARIVKRYGAPGSPETTVTF
jgi:hypothetical protein